MQGLKRKAGSDEHGGEAAGGEAYRRGSIRHRVRRVQSLQSRGPWRRERAKRGSGGEGTGRGAGQREGGRCLICTRCIVALVDFSWTMVKRRRCAVEGSPFHQPVQIWPYRIFPFLYILTSKGNNNNILFIIYICLANPWRTYRQLYVIQAPVAWPIHFRSILSLVVVNPSPLSSPDTIPCVGLRAPRFLATRQNL